MRMSKFTPGHGVLFYFLTNAFNLINLFTFGCMGSLLLLRLFCSCGEQALLSTCAWASRCDGFFCWGARSFNTKSYISIQQPRTDFYIGIRQIGEHTYQ